MKGFFNSVGDVFRRDPNRTDDFGFTRLQRAIAENNLPRVIALIKAGADVNFRGKLLYPPLHMALERDRQSIALALIQAGADINLQDGHGRVPLHYATSQGQTAIIHALLTQGADVHIADAKGQTPLHTTSTARPDIIPALVARGAKPNAQDEDGNTPLHLFLEKQEVVESLVLHGADINVRNKKGFSPFQLSMDESLLRRCPRLMTMLLIHGKPDLEAPNALGEHFIHFAARCNRDADFMYALHRADLSACNAQGENVLHILAADRNVGLMLYALRHLRADAAPLLSCRNDKGCTPLGALLGRANKFFGEEKSCERIELAARLMISAGADIRAASDKGYTLVHYAVDNDRGAFLELIAAHKADLDARDRKGRTALHAAIEDKKMAMVDKLLDLGANPDMPDASGWTVLDRLAEKGDRDSPIVQRLIVAGGQYRKQLPLNPDLMRDPGGKGDVLGKTTITRRPGSGPRLGD